MHTFTCKNHNFGSKIKTVEYVYLFIESLKGFGGYMWNEISFQATPWYQNYFWLLVLLSLLVWGLEVTFPWRKNQKVIGYCTLIL